MLQHYRGMPPALAHLISSVFMALAGFMLYLGTTLCIEVQTAKHWVEVPAQRIASFKEARRDPKRKGEPTIRIAGRYAYSWQGAAHEGERIEFAAGANNFSLERQEVQWARLHSDTLYVYVNPLNPSQSVLDRSFPAPLMAFYAIFLIVPCILGIAWFWCLPLAWVGPRHYRVVRRWCYVGIAATLVYFPTISIALFASELGAVQWSIFAAIYGLTSGFWYWLTNKKPSMEWARTAKKLKPLR